LRITVAEGAHVTGRLFRSDAQGIVVRRDGDTMRVAWDEVARLEIARARRTARPVRTGATVGAVIGLLVGGIGAATCEDSFLGPCPEAIPLGLATGLAVGSAVGVAIWGASREGRWKEIPVDLVRVGVMPRRDGFGIGASIAF
jgi:hypothetical protein